MVHLTDSSKPRFLTNRKAVRVSGKCEWNGAEHKRLLLDLFTMQDKLPINNLLTPLIDKQFLTVFYMRLRILYRGLQRGRYPF
jgi:hypothetical protein